MCGVQGQYKYDVGGGVGGGLRGGLCHGECGHQGGGGVVHISVAWPPIFILFLEDGHWVQGQ